MEFEAAVLPNGHSADDLGQVAGEDAAQETAQLEPAAEQAPRGLYLVRIPKQPMDDTLLKKHQAEFQGIVAKLKEMNGALQAKREVVRNLRAQMGDARGLKENSQPEFDDKFGRMKELRELRTQYVNRIKAIRENVKGLDCKNEQEIDLKIREMEYRISHEGMPLREEKQLLQQIARLNAQRAKVREFSNQEAELKELESEADKIKAILGDMDGEFNVIKTERDATNRVVKDISETLKKAKEELDSLVAEHAELVALKENTLKALDGSRDETNASMRDYRENRKFSLTVRDLVAAGQTEEAAALVREQVDEWVGKLSSDPVYRAEYLTLTAANRKFPVSELLPQSCTTVQAPGANGAGRGGARGAAGARPPPPEPNGPAKAKALIEQLMQDASKEAAANRARAAVNGGSDADAEEEFEGPTVAAPVKKAPETIKAPAAGGGITTASNSTGSAKLVQDAGAAAAAAFNYKVELPKVAESEAFVAPVLKSDVEVQTKEMLREEQIRKAQEAEERKRKRAELAERKKVQAAESAKRLEAERKERDQAARAEAARAKTAAATASSRAVEVTEEPVDDTVAAAPSVQQQQMTKMSAPTPFEKRQQVAAAKRFKPKNTPVKQAQSFWNQYQGWIVLAVVLLLCIILGLAFLL